MLAVREVYDDWSARRGTITIERTDTIGTSPAAGLTQDALAKRYAVAGKMLIARINTWFMFPEWFYLNEPVNTITAPRLTPGGLSSQYSSVGHYDVADDEAIVLTVPRGDAPYLGFQLGTPWYTSLDYIHHQTSLNGHQAQVDPDGNIRLVIAETNPGVANWVERIGHDRGYLQFRWQRRRGADHRGADAAGGPDGGPARCAAVLRVQRRDARTVGRTHSRAPARRSRKVDRMILQDKVVVVAGFGPGLGSVARTARAGGRREAGRRRADGRQAGGGRR